MQMNSLFAAGFFDAPWLVIVIVLVSAAVNWLSKRRQEQLEKRALEGDQPGKPPGGFDFEETLRRLLGEELPARTPPPPRLPQAAQGELPPMPASAVRRPPVPLARTTATAVREHQEQAAYRLEQSEDEAIHLTAVGHKREKPSGEAKHDASRWRDPRTARQAFVASIIFAPPKSLEP